jgi:hypothetical protein
MADGWPTIDGNELPWEVHDVTIETYDDALSPPARDHVKVVTLHILARHVCVDADLGVWAIDGYPVPWLIASPEEFPFGIEGTQSRYLRVALPLLLFADYDTTRNPIAWDDTDQAPTPDAA